jgi:hypothetical protein
VRASIFILFSLVVLGCDEPTDDCPNIWQLEKAQIAAFAKADNQQLNFEVFNAEGPNAIRLEQMGLEGDFQLNLELLALEADSPSVPQFRFEVFDETAPGLRYSGIAIQPDTYYCYVGNSQPENRDNRLAHFNGAAIRITRLNDTLTCEAVVDGIALSIADTFLNEPLGVRLVFGTTANSSGSSTATVDNFQIMTESVVLSDDFSCRSW